MIAISMIYLIIFLSFSSLVMANENCTDPLQCYLNDMELIIPNICIPVNNETGSEFCLNNFACHGFYIGNIDSSYVYDRPASLEFGVLNFETDCTGSWTYDRHRGNLDASVANTDILVDFYVTKEASTMLPTQLEFDQCDLASCDVELTFSGSLISEVLDFISPIIERIIKTAVYDILCVKVADLLYYNATAAIVNVLDPKLVELMASTPSTPPMLSSTEYIDWNDSMIGKVHTLLNQFANATTSVSPENFLNCMNSTHDLSVINTLMEKITNRTGDITIPLGNISLGNLSITALTISGFDTMSNVGLLIPSEQNPQLMLSTISLKELTVDISMTLDMYEYQENSSLVIRISDVTLEMDLLLAINEAKLQSLPLSQLSELSCLGDAVDMFNITNLSVIMSVDLISIYELGGVAGDLEADIINYLDNTLLLITNGFGDLLSSVITGVFQGPVREGINDQVNSLLHDSICPPYFPPTTTDMIVWAESTVIQMIDTIANDMLGPIGLNKLMTCVTNNTGVITIQNLTNEYTRVMISGLNSFYEFALFYPIEGSPYNLGNQLGLGYCDHTSSDPADCTPFSIAIEGNFIFRPDYYDQLLMNLGQGQLNQISSFSSFLSYGINSLLSLIFESSSASSIAFVATEISATAETTVSRARTSHLNELVAEYKTAASASTTTSFTDTSAVVTAPVPPIPVPSGDTITYLAMTLENFNFHLNTMIEMDKNAMGALAVSQLSTTGCVPSTMKAVAIDTLSVNMTAMDVLVQNETKTFNVTPLVQAIFDRLGSPERLAQKNKNYEDQLSMSAATCANGGVEPSSGGDGSFEYSNAWKWQMGVLVSGCICILIAFIWFFGRWGRNKRKGCLGMSGFDNSGSGSGSGSSGSRTRYDKHGNAYQSSSFSQEQEDEILSVWEEVYWTYGFEHSLAFHKELPLWFRVGVPIAILSCTALFINSNLDPEAVVVMANIYAGNEVIHSPPVFSFGLASTVNDMWDAKVYALAALIAFFSGAWPYIKLMTMLAMWVLPPSIVTPPTRENVFIWLDILGKWSLIDVNVMVMMMVAFYFTLVVAPELAIEVIVVSKFGFFGFLLATMASLGIGHIVLAGHRAVHDPKIDYQQPEVVKCESVMTHLFLGSRSYYKDLYFNTNQPTQPDKPEVRLGYTPAGRLFVVTWIFITAAMTVVGTFLNTFNFEFKGLVGLMLKDAADIEYGYVQVGDALPDASGEPNDFSVRWIQVCYYLFGLGMPLALLSTLLFLWIVPLSLHRQRQVFVLAEVLNAWTALDVFCISILAALLELQQFAAFIVGDSCDGINEVLTKYLDGPLEGDDKCFDVVARLKPNCWTIFLAAVLLIMVGIPLLKITHRVLEERMQSEDCTADDRAHRLSESQSYLSGENIHKSALTGLENQQEEDDEECDIETEETERALKKKLLREGHINENGSISLIDPVIEGGTENDQNNTPKELGWWSRLTIQSEIHIINWLVKCNILEYTHPTVDTPVTAAAVGESVGVVTDIHSDASAGLVEDKSM